VVRPTSGFALFGKKSAPPPNGGIEIVVEFPEPGTAVGEITALGRVFGTPSPAFVESAGQDIVPFLKEVRLQLNNFQERRKHPRIAADFQITLFPLHPDDSVDVPVNGRCVNVTEGGLALRAALPPNTKYAYVAFESVRGTEGLAVLLQIIKTNRQDDGAFVTGRYRLDL
jgi:hypothetical protein